MRPQEVWLPHKHQSGGNLLPQEHIDFPKSSYRSPCTSETSKSSAFSSSSVSTIPTEPRFSSMHFTLFVPGIGTTSSPRLVTQAKVLWPGAQPRDFAISITLSTRSLFLAKFSVVNRGLFFRKSLSLGGQNQHQSCTQEGKKTLQKAPPSRSQDSHSIFRKQKDQSVQTSCSSLGWVLEQDEECQI